MRSAYEIRIANCVVVVHGRPCGRRETRERRVAAIELTQARLVALARILVIPALLLVMSAPVFAGVDRMEPSSGGLHGTLVSLTGTGLNQVTSVRFDSTTVGLMSKTDTEIRVQAPQRTTPGNVPVTVIFGAAAFSVPGGFTYGVPVIAGVTPNFGPVTGNTIAVIEGSNFLNATTIAFTSVVFGNVYPAARILSNTRIEVTTSDAAAQGWAAGTIVDVTVGNRAGSAVYPNAYTFTAGRPAVTNMAPVSGSVLGGDQITLTGTNLNLVTSVSFGASTIDRANFTSTTASQIRFNAPPGPAGGVAVSVSDTIGSIAVTGGYTYTLVRPAVTAMTPVSGSTLGGNQITLTGTDLNFITSVSFGASTIDRASFTSTTASQIGFNAPPGPAGGVAVSVSDTIGSIAVTGGYTYTVGRPAVTSMAPVSGSVLGGNQITLNGTNLDLVTSVSFGASTIDAANFAPHTASQIGFNAPPGSAGDVEAVSISDASGSIGVTGNYTYLPDVPIVSGVSPDYGVLGTAMQVVISGSGFLGAIEVRFGGVAVLAVDFTVNPAGSEISLTTPPLPSSGVAGAVNVEVDMGLGVTGTRAGAYTYDDPPSTRPVITDIFPATGSTAGGTRIRITGSRLYNLVANNPVTFGGLPATSIVNSSDTQIEVDTPAHAPGLVDVVVMTAHGSTIAASFDYGASQAGAPVISGISPSSGSTAGGTRIRITGLRLSGLVANNPVTFGGIAAASIVSSSDTQIEVDTPAHAAGNVDVVVTTVNGSGLAARFDYVPQASLPVITSPVAYSVPATQDINILFTATGGSGTYTWSAPAFGQLDGLPFAAALLSADGRLTAPAAAAVAGSYSVMVTVADAAVPSATASARVTITVTASPVAPTIYLVTPNSGPVAGGTLVTLTGTNLSTALSVTFGAGQGSSFVALSDTQLTVRTPAMAAGGGVDITVVTPSGSFTLPGGFTYETARSGPSITSGGGLCSLNAGGTPLAGLMAALAGLALAATGLRANRAGRARIM